VNAGGCIGQTRPAPKPGDIINNGADDDGSGTVALMALARAYAQGPKPKRSLLFVWHSGEEAGLFGSRFEADYPVVPIQNIVAVLNMDMVGRNRCD
jgi:Zn-dependent M28 family amino/carboxypeptidase